MPDEVEFENFVPEAHIHRGTDADGNPDDNLTEEEALAQAKEEGIEFVDEYKVGDEVFTTLKKAQDAQAKLDDPDSNPIIQTRRRK